MEKIFDLIEKTPYFYVITKKENINKYADNIADQAVQILTRINKGLIEKGEFEQELHYPNWTILNAGEKLKSTIIETVANYLEKKGWNVEYKILPNTLFLIKVS